MSEKRKSFEELRAHWLEMVNRLGFKYEQRWRHRKSGAVVQLILVSYREEDLSPLVTYQHEEVFFTRTLGEFTERFEEVSE